jgi:hypothetical protein
MATQEDHRDVETPAVVFEPAAEPKKTKKKAKKEVPKFEPKPKRKRAPRNDMADSTKAMSFTAWFTNKLNSDKRVREYHHDQLLAYMRGIGLSENEPTTKFETGLRQYFGE